MIGTAELQAVLARDPTVYSITVAAQVRLQAYTEVWELQEKLNYNNECDNSVTLTQKQ